MTKPSNVTHLKDDINRGRTGDKSPGFDPAAAPLGTDEEAAGTPPSAAEIEQARRLENRGGPARPNGVEPDHAPSGGRTGKNAIPMLAAAAMVIVLIIVIAMMVG